MPMQVALSLLVLKEITNFEIKNINILSKNLLDIGFYFFYLKFTNSSIDYEAESSSREKKQFLQTDMDYTAHSSSFLLFSQIQSSNYLTRIFGFKKKKRTLLALFDKLGSIIIASHLL